MSYDLFVWGVLPIKPGLAPEDEDHRWVINVLKRPGKLESLPPWAQGVIDARYCFELTLEGEASEDALRQIWALAGELSQASAGLIEDPQRGSIHKVDAAGVASILPLPKASARRGTMVGDLLKTPKYQEQQARRAEAAAKLDAELSEAAAPLLSELKDAGCGLRDRRDLMGWNDAPRNAQEILVRHLDRPYPPVLRASIVGALLASRARFAWGRLVTRFSIERDANPKNMLANALIEMCDKTNWRDLVPLVEDERNGDTRFLLLEGIVRAGKRDAAPLLLQLQRLPEAAGFVERYMKKLQKGKASKSKDPS